MLPENGLDLEIIQPKIDRLNSVTKNTTVFEYDLEQLTKKEEIVKFEDCFTNKYGMNLKESKTFLVCPNHPEKDFYVCEPCAKNCHNMNIEAKGVKKTEKKDHFICRCAEQQHKKCKNITKEIVKSEKNCQSNILFRDICKVFFEVDRTTCVESDNDYYDNIPEERNLRKCLFCVIFHIESRKESSDSETIMQEFDSYVRRIIPVEELEHIEEKDRCECKGDHHNISSDLNDAETISLFFKAVVYCVKFPEFMNEKFKLNAKILICYMYNKEKNMLIKKSFDDYFDSQINNEKQDDFTFEQETITINLTLFAQFFSNLIENYQMSDVINPFSDMIQTSEMIDIFKMPQIKCSLKDTWLKQVSIAVFFNFNILPKLFITSRSIFKNDLNFSPFHRNYFLSDISTLFDSLGGEQLFFDFLDSMSNFLTEASVEADLYLAELIENIFIIVIYYFIQILKSFQYYKIKKVSILKRVIDYLKVILASYEELVKFDILSHPDKPKQDSEEKPEEEEQKKEDIISWLNNMTAESKKIAVNEALNKIQKKFDFSEYLDTLIYGVQVCDGEWIVDEVEEIAKMILVKYNDIGFEKSILKLDGGSEKYCFQKNDFTKELLTMMFNPDNKYSKIENIDIIDMLVHRNDCYAQQLSYCSISKFNEIFRLEEIYKIPNFGDNTELERCTNSLKKSLNEYLFCTITKESFETQLEYITNDLKHSISTLFGLYNFQSKIESNGNISKKELIHMQIYYANKGYMIDLLEIMMTLIREDLVSMKYFKNIFTTLEFFIFENPFLSLLLFSEEVYTSLLTKSDLEFYKDSLLFYFKAANILFKYSYKIDLSNFFLTFFLNKIEITDIISEYKVYHLINLLLKQILKVRLLKDFSNPMSRILQIIDKFRQKIDIPNLMKRVFIDNDIPEEFKGEMDDNINSSDEEDLDNKEEEFEKSNMDSIVNDNLLLNDNKALNEKKKIETSLVYSNTQNLTMEKKIKLHYKKYPKLKIFFQYIVSYYRLLIMLDEEKKALFKDGEIEIISEILFKAVIPPNITRVLAAIISSFEIQMHENKKSKAKGDKNSGTLFFVIKSNDKSNVENEAEVRLKKIEKITIDLIQSTYTSFKQFPKTFLKNPKLYISYFNDLCVTPTVFCSFRINFLRESFNYKNKYSFYTIVLSFLIAFKYFLENILSYDKYMISKNKTNDIIESTNRMLVPLPNTQVEQQKVKPKYKNDFLTTYSSDDVFKLVDDFAYYSINKSNCREILDKIELDISLMQSDNFDPFSMFKIIEIFKYYCKYINIPTVCSPFDDNSKKYNNPVIIDILTEYDTLKTSYTTLAINNVTKKGDPLNNQIKQEILLTCERAVSKKESRLDINRYAYFLFKTKAKLFKIDKDLFQNHALYSIIGNDFNDNIISYVQRLFSENILNQYLSVLGTSQSFEYNIYLSATEFYSFLCLNSNENSQAFLSELGIAGKKKETKPILYHFLKTASNILKYIAYYNSKEKFISFLETQPKSVYFRKLYSSIIFLFTNLTTGSFPSVYFNAFKINAFYSWFDQNMAILNKINKSESFAYYCRYFFKFCSAFIEDAMRISKKDYSEYQRNGKKLLPPIKYILKSLKPSLLANILKINLRKAFDQYLDEKDTDPASKNITKTIDYSTDTLLLLYKYHTSFIKKNKYLLCEEIYNFLMNLKYKTDNTIKIDNLISFQIKNKSVEFLFFSQIFKCVEISVNSEFIVDEKIKKHQGLNQEQREILQKMEEPREKIKFPEKHVFKIAPQCLYLSTKDYEDLYNNVNMENISEKQNAILDLVGKLKPLAYNRDMVMKKSNKFIRGLFSFNYLNENVITKYSIYLTVIISLVVNIMILSANFTIDNLNKSSGVFVENDLMKDVYWINLGHVVLLFMIIMNWIVFNVFYQIQLSRWSAIYGKFAIYSNFILGIIALTNYNSTFLYSLQLFSMISLSSTMKMVVKAVSDKYENFATTGVLIMIIVWIFTGIAFYYVRDDYLNADLNTNLCDSYFHCFLTLFNYGLRVGFVDSNVLSVENEYYYPRFIFEWLFFFFINLILLNAINGIIVDTFQTFREEDNKQRFQISNVCYICSLQRGQLEMWGVNFDNHVNNDHYTYSYLDLLVTLNYRNEFEMNYVDFYTINLLRQKLSNFLPNKTCFSLRNMKIT